MAKTTGVQETMKPVPQASAAEPPQAATLGLKVPMKRTGRLVNRHIDLQLVQSHAQAWRDLYDGLYEAHATLKDGKFVENPNDAIRWLFENINKAVIL